MLDLIPADLPVERSLDALRMVDFSTYRKSRLAEGRGACQALAVTNEVLERADVRETSDLDPAAMMRVTEQLKRYACSTTDVAVAPQLRSSRDEPRKRLAW